MASKTLSAFVQRAGQVDEALTLLKAQVNKLKTSAVQEEVAKLKAENEDLKAKVEKAKQELIAAELKNGKAQYFGVPAPNPAAPPTSAPVAPAAVASPAVSLPVTQPAPSSTEEKIKKESKPKGDAKPKSDAKPKEPEPVADEKIDVSRVDFRVALIVKAERHPDAEKLYLEEVETGEATRRTVISGLVDHVPIDQMQNRLVILCMNLKPAKMRGITSQAMVMCAKANDKVEILIPPAGAVPGDIVEFEGYPRNPDPEMNPKKKIFETVQPDLRTDGNKVATYKGIPFTIKGKGVVSSPTLANAVIS